ncbi:IS110 family RNA-guided transposase [Anaerosporobacter sp.]
MISVGIDVSKDKSTVCILAPHGSIMKKPYIVEHTKESINELVLFLHSLHEETKIVMESTGIYHLPILKQLLSHNLFVSVINPLLMNKYANTNIRPGKTDKKDSITIANYGIDNWYKLQSYNEKDTRYEQLRLLSRQYNQYINMRVKCKLGLLNLLEQAMPQISTLIENDSQDIKRDKLNGFVKKYWHYDNITKFSQQQFITNYNQWAKKEGYRTSQSKAEKIYALANSKIPTLSSQDPSTKMLILEAIRMYREINTSTDMILTQMKNIAKTLVEYDILISMKGIGEKLAPRFIAEVGDVRRFHNASALIAYAGIDAPAYQSGQFYGTNRRISKRGSKSLRKVGYEIMASFTRQKPIDNDIYIYIKKKELEGKPKKVAKVAGLNKFLRIYYAKVRDVNHV